MRQLLFLLPPMMLAACAPTSESYLAPDQLIANLRVAHPLRDLSTCLTSSLGRTRYHAVQPTTTFLSTPEGQRITQWFLTKAVHERVVFNLVKAGEGSTQVAIYLMARSGQYERGRYGPLSIEAVRQCAVPDPDIRQGG